jgi:dihydroxyacetone kinase-like protein
MKESLRKEDVFQILEEISKIMDENKDYLCRLDGALGDGDIGLTMSKGFKAIVSNLPNLADQDIGGIFVQCALLMGETVASTIGTLISAGLLHAGKALSGKNELSKEDLILLFEAMIKGISGRGKAKVGEKTILDSLGPAAQAMALANSQQVSLKEMMNRALEAAENGVKETISMQSKHGRASRYLERSIGLQDPGATVGALMIKGFVRLF